MTNLKHLEAIKNDSKALYEFSLSLLKTVDNLEAKVKKFEEGAALKRFKEYNTKSEKECNLFTHEDYEHFNEAESNADDTTSKVINEKNGEVKKVKGKNFVNEVELEIEEKTHIIENLECDKCEGTLVPIGTKETYSLKYIPAKVIKVKNIQHTYKCNCCDETNIKTAPKNNPFVKTMVEPSFVAGIIYNKTYNSLPLYRQEREFKSLGLDIRRNNLSNWFIHGASLLKPLFELMHKDVISNDIVHMDETTINVIQKKNKKNSSGFMWLLRSCKHDNPINLYFYKDSREHYHANELLGDFKGYLHSDGYEAYYKNSNIKNVACWAHARRKVYDAMLLAQKNKNNDSIAQELFNLIQHLYEIEQSISEYIKVNKLSQNKLIEYTYEQRQLLSKPILDNIKSSCESYSLTVLPKSKTGTAIAYINSYIKSLFTYIEDGRLAIDNNISERSAKAFAIGRKNFLFSYSELGAESSSICYSIVHSAAENNLNIFEYLTYVFENLCDSDLKTENELRKLLPYSVDLPKSLFIK